MPGHLRRRHSTHPRLSIPGLNILRRNPKREKQVRDTRGVAVRIQGLTTALPKLIGCMQHAHHGRPVRGKTRTNRFAA